MNQRNRENKMDSEIEYLSSRRRSKGDHVSQSRNDVDSEADEKRSNSGVDRTKEREDDSKEPNRDDHRKPSKSPLAHTLALMHSYELLPHKIQWCACKSKCYELHQPNTKCFI